MVQPFGLRTWICVAALGVFAGLEQPLAAQAPTGFKVLRNEEAGFEFFCPRTFKVFQHQPGDPVMLARFIRELAPDKKQSNRPTRSVSQLEIWVISMQKPRTSFTGTENLESSGDDANDGPRNAQEALEERLNAHSFAEFVEKRMRGFEISSKEETEVKKRGRVTEYRMDQKAGISAVKAIAWTYDVGGSLLGLVGVAPKAEFPKAERTFRKSGHSLKAIEIEPRNTSRIERFYRQHEEFKDPEFRIRRRLQLVQGWKAEDTPNYLIVYHSKDSSLLNRVKRDIEAMRAFYEKTFPPVEPVQVVSVVRICKDRQEYLRYGGSSKSAGYWNSAREELVLYDNVAGKEGSRFGNGDSYIVLKHEAFHQYIHYSTGELPPHSWFNEGYGDYFSGAVVTSNTRRIKDVKTNPWRLDRIKDAVDKGRHVPLEKLVRAEQGEYYRDGPLYYAEGWAFVYFLNKSKAAQKHEVWSKILATYFETLKDEYGRAVKELGEDATLKARAAAGKEARDAAVDRAFRGVNFQELEGEWKAFVKKLR